MTKWIKNGVVLSCVFALTNAFGVEHSLSPGGVGWGNLLVPGLGATFRGEPLRGVGEAVLELGLFYGGTFGVREGEFTIDSTIVLPQRGNLYRPLIGQSMQQVGLKLHMYNTFYHYQQACLAMKDSERETNNSQKLYTGTWDEVLTAPFRWKNLSNPFVYGMVLLAAGGLAYAYHNDEITRNAYRPTGGEEALYGMNTLLLMPMGSAFGEEPLFRGFMQREFNLYTGSTLAAVLMQTAIFTAMHPENHYVPAFAGGLYFGFLTHHFDGNIEPAVAAHFWVNFISGIFDYLSFRLKYGKDAPWGPNVKLALSFPLAL